MILSKIFILNITLLCIFSLSACAKVEETEHIAKETEQSSTPPALSEDPEAEIFEDIESEIPEEVKSEITESESTEPEDISSEQMQWQVYICPDMPQPYIEVLKQYEQFMNANVHDINDEDVLDKLWGGEWKYLYNELCAHLTSYQKNHRPDTETNYTLADLTGDGFPEMIMTYYENMPDVIYYYSDANGIGMEYLTSYFDMTIYQNGIVEYVSGGMYSSTTYLQFQEDVDAWVVVDTIAVDLIDDVYYGGNWVSGFLDTEITEEEYLRIQEKYVTEPMEFEWIPLFLEPFPE